MKIITLQINCGDRRVVSELYRGVFSKLWRRNNYTYRNDGPAYINYIHRYEEYFNNGIFHKQIDF